MRLPFVFRLRLKFHVYLLNEKSLYGEISRNGASV